jgi:hypothetical protein
MQSLKLVPLGTPYLIPSNFSKFLQFSFGFWPRLFRPQHPVQNLFHLYNKILTAERPQRTILE